MQRRWRGLTDGFHAILIKKFHTDGMACAGTFGAGNLPWLRKLWRTKPPPNSGGWAALAEIYTILLNCGRPLIIQHMTEMKNHCSKTGYNRFLLLVAGLGGLLFGLDVGIISGALPHLEATSGLNAGQLSFIVAAVLLGGVISTLFAGALAD